MRELAAVSQGKSIGKKFNYAEESAAIDAELDDLLSDFKSNRGIESIAPKRGGGTPKGASAVAALKAAADTKSRLSTALTNDKSTEQGTPDIEPGPKVASMRTNSARRSQKLL